MRIVFVVSLPNRRRLAGIDSFWLGQEGRDNLSLSRTAADNVQRSLAASGGDTILSDEMCIFEGALFVNGRLRRSSVTRPTHASAGSRFVGSPGVRIRDAESYSARSAKQGACRTT